MHVQSISTVLIIMFAWIRFDSFDWMESPDPPSENPTQIQPEDGPNLVWSLAYLLKNKERIEETEHHQ